MAHLQSTYDKFKEALGSDVTGQVAILLAELGNEVSKTEKKLEDAIADAVSKKEKIQALTEQVEQLTISVAELQEQLKIATEQIEKDKPLKEKLEELSKKMESEDREKHKELVKLLTVNEKSPLYEKVQKIKEFFTLPKSENEELPIETIRANLEAFKPFQKAGYLELPDTEEPPKHEKSSKPEFKDKDKEESGALYQDLFKDFDRNQT